MNVTHTALVIDVRCQVCARWVRAEAAVAERSRNDLRWWCPGCAPPGRGALRRDNSRTYGQGYRAGFRAARRAQRVRVAL